MVPSGAETSTLGFVVLDPWLPVCRIPQLGPGPPTIVGARKRPLLVLVVGIGPRGVVWEGLPLRESVLQPGAHQQGAILHLCHLAFSPSLGQQLTRLPVGAVVTKQHEAAHALLGASNRRRAVKATCHGNPTGMRAVPELDAMVQASSGVVRAERVADGDELWLGPRVAVVVALHQSCVCSLRARRA